MNAGADPKVGGEGSKEEDHKGMEGRGGAFVCFSWTKKTPL